MNRAVVAINFGLFLVLALAVWAAPQGRYVLVLADPAQTPQGMLEVIGKAGGLFVEQGRFPWLAVAYSEAEDFPERLRQSGALLVLNHSLAVGCQRG
ncbi:hypothetical protein [Rhizobium sp. RU36D]|uniref:hypothetical protein n=1 Tax=Rhizobium sp. RU36D TaxID=1907415 RepID=UPI0009D89622|nr:hypothetical protein [Rhizobium sp. RU36D]SMD06776.1 hypothetical protein SAMN05880593_11919 [Rhizobium sp. RU36D]